MESAVENKNMRLFRCGLMNVTGCHNELDQSLLPSGCDKKVVSSSIRFTLDKQVQRTEVMKYSKDTKFPGSFEWIWQTDPAELATKELTVEYALLRLKKKQLLCFIAGKAKIDALSLATGPVKWELELFTVKEGRSIGFIKFDLHMEQFNSTHLHANFSVFPHNGMPVPTDLHPEIIQLTDMKQTSIKDLPRQVERSLEELNSSQFSMEVRAEASIKGLSQGALLVILAPKYTSQRGRDILVGSYFKIPIVDFLVVDDKPITYETSLISKEMVVGKVTLSVRWSNLPTYAQLIGGFYNSASGLSGGHSPIQGVHATVIKNQKQNTGTLSQVRHTNTLTALIQDDSLESDLTSEPVRRPKLQSRPSQFFSGFTAEVDEKRIVEAKKVQESDLEALDDWSEVGLEGLDSIDKSEIVVKDSFAPKKDKPSMRRASAFTSSTGTSPAQSPSMQVRVSQPQQPQQPQYVTPVYVQQVPVVQHQTVYAYTGSALPNPFTTNIAAAPIGMAPVASPHGSPVVTPNNPFAVRTTPAQQQTALPNPFLTGPTATPSPFGSQSGTPNPFLRQ
eukprot:TRINITY_DN1443_c0_g2_i1.p1 TRINITY_DN1443_c0_g2~~TRINITY_DN1443_c0_g2_i1.p1  ORF type:complete len:603 (+),score=125.44 TRINITY_DN1443_c0_g2_i1:126-1811(+)